MTNRFFDFVFVRRIRSFPGRFVDRARVDWRMHPQRPHYDGWLSDQNEYDTAVVVIKRSIETETKSKKSNNGCEALGYSRTHHNHINSEYKIKYFLKKSEEIA